MRPLFAIAPLAGLLLLIGPQPREAEQLVSDFKSRWLGDAANEAQRDVIPPRERSLSRSTGLIGERNTPVSARAALER